MNFLVFIKQVQLDDNYPYEHDIIGFFLEPHTRSFLTKDLINTIHNLMIRMFKKEMIELGIDNFIY